MTTGSAAALNHSGSSTRSSRSSSSTSTKPSLSLDLSNLPPLSHPSPPSNTLLITDLNDLHIFQPPSLANIRSTINEIAPLNSFSPLPSLRRIVCSFLSTDDAIRVRQQIEMATSSNDLLNFNNKKKGTIRSRVYFGERTPIEGTEEARRGKLLEAPQSQKMFFISPPPSPPAGWVMRNEGPPNKDVHATDLSEALAMLRTEHQQQQQQQLQNVHQNTDVMMSTDPASPVSVNSASSPVSSDEIDGKITTRTSSWPLNSNATGNHSTNTGSGQRSRSSTLIYHPSDHGGSPNLPAVMVVDTSVQDCGEEDVDGDIDMAMDMDTVNPAVVGGGGKKIFAHTARPPVELIE